ncbi:MAG: tetratricopeptide repeat protein [Bacteroidales bacterium]|jgi:hypothetical protein|nr:hypothetical protein [Bacteroidales bacterium]MDD3700882.1 hypothetical protein [Bacteroidales bacterium]MDY0369821.1 hypothetical protein [Bacteroidales bacterium]
MRLTYFIFLGWAVSLLAACTTEYLPVQAVEYYFEPYLNHHDSATYVGMRPCLECHYPIYESYMRTGMGRSFGRASPSKSDAVIGPDSVIYDPHTNFYYQPYWRDSILYVKEFRLEQHDTTHQRIEKVDFVIGSGNHTNSHIYSINGYLFQIPFTYYTQKQRFDLPPGFEDGHNSRFGRSLGLECISCHNGLPELVIGSENKYASIPEGIDCERCHGPGSIHVDQKRAGILVDTALYIDYSIVNPGRLPRQLQNDVCARCHLQGTMVLKPDKSFYDYRPGMALTKVMDIFMPVFEGGTDDLIMASHVERMMDSRCYIESNAELSCLDCHNPHFPVSETPINKFTNACLKCHGSTHQSQCRLPEADRLAANNACTLCHMPGRDSRDIPHVVITDHKIINPATEQKGVKRFKGLKAINNPATDALTKAKGYLREFETYHDNPAYLDSAARYLNPSHKKTDAEAFKAKVQYFYLIRQYASIIKLVNNQEKDLVLGSWLTKTQLDNHDAWTAYRIGQAFENKNRIKESLVYYERAIQLAPYQLDFLNKFGSVLVATNQLTEAKRIFARIINENPRYDMAWVNLGYVELQLQNIKQAHQSFVLALRLNPDNEQALLNLASYYAAIEQNELAIPYLIRVLQLRPDHEQAHKLLHTIRKPNG